MNHDELRLGIDVGSTTVKVVVLDRDNKIIYSKYSRHMSNIFMKVSELLEELYSQFALNNFKVTITGSGGLSLAQILDLSFEQEVIACSKAVETFIPQTDVAIELGGEDAKMTFYRPSIEQRMNGTCAGGTGAFIDQMAVLLNTDSMGVNEYAKESKIIYPIAARCGVFAKTDIQPLINEGAKKEDISASIFQSVVNQTITGLACGRRITGNIAFLGGPLHFLSELRYRFIVTLGLTHDQIIFPDEAHYYVAMGAAILAEKHPLISMQSIMDKVRTSKHVQMTETKYLEPLFKNQEEYDEFSERHNKNKVKVKDISNAKGECFLGIDAGSTTTKAALVDRKGALLYSFYKNNDGKPLEATADMLKELYAILPKSAYIAHAVSTGYGEALVQAAYTVDSGEIETMAHFRAAEYFMPGVDFILDIGGQDMKCMMIRDGFIYNIMLNEACSSGCGSFIETYAKSMDLSVIDFSKEAIFAENPVDLGTRCTVFMNSKIKQSQKEGATIGDISAGLSYSVIKNAMYKVIKLRNPDNTGNKVVVQGGTFLNEAVLRSVEKVLGRDVVRPDISGIMGAYGAALIGIERYVEGTHSNIINLEDLNNFTAKVTTARCGRCENKCLMTINSFPDNKKFVIGNRCEKGSGQDINKEEVSNLYEYKYNRLFSYYTPLEDSEAKSGVIGIPRVLNMYENYPFWFTVFTKLGFKVVLSPHSSKSIYELGMETISSDTACYPAKLVHGHIKWLADNGVKRIFYPAINFEMVEDETANNHFNCPIVATYPEVIVNNMDDFFIQEKIKFLHPFLPYDNKEKLIERLHFVLGDYFISLREIEYAVKAGIDEDTRFKADIRNRAVEILEQNRKEGRKTIVLAGRPYHLDPEINHGIDKIITSYGMSVLTEDSIAHLVKATRPIRVLDQWAYHSRLYRAAELVSLYDDMELVQINSFGCGLDAVTIDQVSEILDANNKLHTVIKIDEGANLGAARIRIRSLKAAIEARDKNGIKPMRLKKEYFEKVGFTKKMREEHTIIVPQMAPYHFRFLESALRSEGYNIKILPSVDKMAVEKGLRFINNDACYPTIVALGQILNAIQSGEYDLNNTSILLSQTGGGCRASNYIALLRKALKEMGLGHIPVISVNYVGIEKNEGFHIGFKMAVKAVMAVLYGDLITMLLYRVRPYEKEAGSADALYEKWAEKLIEAVKSGQMRTFRRNVRAMIHDFEEFEMLDIVKPKVGVVGEILVKYHPTANNDIVKVIEEEGGEAVVPGLLDFFLYGLYSKKFNYEVMNGTYKAMSLGNLSVYLLEKIRDIIRKELKDSKRFKSPDKIEHLANKAQQILSLGNQCGEGWLLTAEMMELMDTDVENIVCLQPFACLPNHVTGKGMIKALRKYNRQANITAIDFDPGASEVNQLNRIKLMMATAFKNLDAKEQSLKNALEASLKAEGSKLTIKTRAQVHEQAIAQKYEKTNRIKAAEAKI